MAHPSSASAPPADGGNRIQDTYARRHLATSSVLSSQNAGDGAFMARLVRNQSGGTESP